MRTFAVKKPRNRRPLFHLWKQSRLAVIAGIVCVSSAAGLLWIGIAQADSLVGAEMTIRPSRCVALHQGQVCYQNIRIEWKSEQIGNYCIFWDLSDTALHCWEQQNSGIFEYDFQSAKSVAFSLRSMLSEEAEIRSEMSVAWVHKARKRKRLNWRLF